MINPVEVRNFALEADRRLTRQIQKGIEQNHVLAGVIEQNQEDPTFRSEMMSGGDEVEKLIWQSALVRQLLFLIPEGTVSLSDEQTTEVAKTLSSITVYSSSPAKTA